LDKLIAGRFQSRGPVEEGHALILSLLEEPGPNDPVFTLEQCVLLVNYCSKTFLQHFNLYQMAFTREQEQEELSVKKTLEFPDFPLLDLKDARTAESVAREEEEERIRIANIDPFPSDLGLNSLFLFRYL
jgi:hypothetical protein